MCCQERQSVYGANHGDFIYHSKVIIKIPIWGKVVTMTTHNKHSSARNFLSDCHENFFRKVFTNKKFSHLADTSDWYCLKCYHYENVQKKSMKGVERDGVIGKVITMMLTIDLLYFYFPKGCIGYVLNEHLDFSQYGWHSIPSEIIPWYGYPASLVNQDEMPCLLT